MYIEHTHKLTTKGSIHLFDSEICQKGNLITWSILLFHSNSFTIGPSRPPFLIIRKKVNNSKFGRSCHELYWYYYDKRTLVFPHLSTLSYFQESDVDHNHQGNTSGVSIIRINCYFFVMEPNGYKRLTCLLNILIWTIWFIFTFDPCL